MKTYSTPSRGSTHRAPSARLRAADSPRAGGRPATRERPRAVAGGSPGCAAGSRRARRVRGCSDGVRARATPCDAAAARAARTDRARRSVRRSSSAAHGSESSGSRSPSANRRDTGTAARRAGTTARVASGPLVGRVPRRAAARSRRPRRAPARRRGAAARAPARRRAARRTDRR